MHALYMSNADTFAFFIYSYMHNPPAPVGCKVKSYISSPPVKYIPPVKYTPPPVFSVSQDVFLWGKRPANAGVYTAQSAIKRSILPLN